MNGMNELLILDWVKIRSRFYNLNKEVDNLLKNDLLWPFLIRHLIESNRLVLNHYCVEFIDGKCKFFSKIL